MSVVLPTARRRFGRSILLSSRCIDKKRNGICLDPYDIADISDSADIADCSDNADSVDRADSADLPTLDANTVNGITCPNTTEENA